MVNSGDPGMMATAHSSRHTPASIIFSAILRRIGGEFSPTTVASDDGSWSGAGVTDATVLLGDSVRPVVLAAGGAVLAIE